MDRLVKYSLRRMDVSRYNPTQSDYFAVYAHYEGDREYYRLEREFLSYEQGIKLYRNLSSSIRRIRPNYCRYR